MSCSSSELFGKDGFLLQEAVVTPDNCVAICSEVEALDVALIGARNLLEMLWCAELSRKIARHSVIAALMPDFMVAVQCTLFEKSLGQNWLVGLHQDLSIPVRHRVEHAGLQGWSQKDGVWYVQPPAAVLAQLVAVRLHLDVCDIDDGPLRVVPGTHREGRISAALAEEKRSQIGETACCLAVGGALIMRPLLLHASSRSMGISRRRVLHFIFGPKELPYGLMWHRYR